MLAEIINNTLIEDYKALIMQGYSAKPPIILYCHIHLMEIKVYKRDAVIQ